MGKQCSSLLLDFCSWQIEERDQLLNECLEDSTLKTTVIDSSSVSGWSFNNTTHLSKVTPVTINCQIIFILKTVELCGSCRRTI